MISCSLDPHSQTTLLLITTRCYLVPVVQAMVIKTPKRSAPAYLLGLRQNILVLISIQRICLMSRKSLSARPLVSQKARQALSRRQLLSPCPMKVLLRRRLFLSSLGKSSVGSLQSHISDVLQIAEEQNARTLDLQNLRTSLYPSKVALEPRASRAQRQAIRLRCRRVYLPCNTSSQLEET